MNSHELKAGDYRGEGEFDTPDAWDYIYALPIEEREAAFAMVRENVTGKGINRGIYNVPEAVEDDTLAGLEEADAAISTLEILYERQGD